MAIQQFELLKKSAVTEIQADLEAAVLADRLLAESAKNAAQLAQTAAETAETNAELAETNAELAETNAEAAKDLAVAAANAFPATNPQVAYHSRVLADSGVIKDLDRLTELYMNQLNLLPYTHFMWDGNAGYKVVDGKLTKAYDMSPNANDGTTSAGTEPYVGGLIADNESLKIKSVNLSVDEHLSLNSTINFLSTDKWAVTFAVNLNKKHEGAICVNTSNNDIIFVTNNNISIYNGESLNFINAISNDEFGKTIIFSINADGNGNLSLYKNGKYFVSLNTVQTNLSVNRILSSIFGGLNYRLNGFLSYLQIIEKNLSAYEIQLQHELLRLQHPEIEGIDIGNQHWATSNYEGVVTGNGTVIPEVQDPTAWAALTTPAWCYYNNDASLGAVYGKLYNPYALLEIAKNPPMGWRVPLEADAIQLSDYLGGYSVAGGKCKVAGTDYWDNGGTNESGLSIIGVGARSETGIFASLKNAGYFHCVRQNGAISWMQFLSADNTLTIVQEANMKQGMSIRLIRNEPVGEDTKIISTGRFATDISSSPKFIPIPFGYKVEAIVINTSNSLTGVTAAFGYGSYTALFENKSMDANTTKTFIPNATEMTYLYQDGFVYVAANGNTGDGMTIDVVLKKIQ